MRASLLTSAPPTGPTPEPPTPPDWLRAPHTQLKAWLRANSIPLDSAVRHDLWPLLARRLALNKTEDAVLDEVTTTKLPRFVDPRLARFFLLNERGRKEVTSVLWQLSQSCPQVTCAPLLYPLCALFLHFSPPEQVYGALYTLVTSSSKDVRFLALSKADRARDAIVLVKLTEKFGLFPKRRFAMDARTKLRNNALDAAFAEYLQWLISLPLAHLVRVIDCFLVEGEKFLFRVALVLALLFEKTRKESITLDQMRIFCQSIDQIISPQQLIRNACKLTRLSRKGIDRERLKAQKREAHSVVGEISTPHAPDIEKDCVFGTRIAPRRFRCQSVEWSELDQLWEWLPERVVVREPLVVFNSEENGHSLLTFFGLVADSEPTVMLIRTTDNQVLGAFCSASWSQRHHSETSHFGTGETFLFALRPHPRKYDWVGLNRESVAHAQQLFQSASGREICVGSGGGKFGLFIDESLTRGRSERCETFDNEPLASSEY